MKAQAKVSEKVSAPKNVRVSKRKQLVVAGPVQTQKTGAVNFTIIEVQESKYNRMSWDYKKSKQVKSERPPVSVIPADASEDSQRYYADQKPAKMSKAQWVKTTAKVYYVPHAVVDFRVLKRTESNYLVLASGTEVCVTSTQELADEVSRTLQSLLDCGMLQCQYA